MNETALKLGLSLVEVIKEHVDADIDLTISEDLEKLDLSIDIEISIPDFIKPLLN